LGVTPADGDVRVRTTAGAWKPLTAAANLPNGSVVDARKGTITLTAAVDADGAEQAAKFSGAVFAFHQPSATRPVTKLELKGGDVGVTDLRTGRVVDVHAGSSRTIRR